MSQATAQFEVTNNTAPAKAPKVLKKKSLTIEEECSVGGAGISIATKSSLTTGKTKPSDIIVIEDFESEKQFINDYIDENGASFDEMQVMDEYLTNKYVKDVSTALFYQHYDKGTKNSTGNKKYNLTQDVLSSSAELNKALSGLAKFEPDQEFLLNNINPEEVAEFVEKNKDLADLLKEDFSHDDLFIKSKILESIAFFIKKPISDVLFDAQGGNDAILQAHPDYIPFIKKDAPKDENDFVRSDKNRASLNAEYILAYITLAQMISLFDEYTVKRLTKEVKATQVAFVKKHLTEEVMEDMDHLGDLVNAIKIKNDPEALATKIRLLTILIDKDGLQKLTPLDKKLEEKLKNPKSKWPAKFNVKAFEREYSLWMLKQDAKYNALVFEQLVAVKASAMSKRFVTDGSAGDITDKEGSVDKIIYKLQSKFDYYRVFLSSELASQKQGTYTTFCGRTVTPSSTKKQRTHDKINALTDVQLLLCTKQVAEAEAEEAAKIAADEEEGIVVDAPVDAEDDESPEVADDEYPEVADSEVPKKKKIEQSKSIPSYGTYICKLYKNAIKSYKYTFAVTDEAFVKMICHVVRDTVNLYTRLAIDSYNSFIVNTIYNTGFSSRMKQSVGKLEPFEEKMALYIKGEIGSDKLPSTIPMLLDLHKAFTKDIHTDFIANPASFCNTACPIAASDISKYKVKANYQYKIELSNHPVVISDEEESTDHSDGEHPKPKAKKSASLPSFEKIFRNHYESSTPKPRNKHTIDFISDLSMVVFYIVALRLNWLGKISTFSSDDEIGPYYDDDRRKEYTSDVVRNLIESIDSSANSNKAFSECIVKVLKNVVDKLGHNKGDIEEYIRHDMDKLRTQIKKASPEGDDSKPTKSKSKNSANLPYEKPVAITNGEKKIISSNAFLANFISDRIKSHSIETKNTDFFDDKVKSLFNYATDLSLKNNDNFETNREEHSGMIVSYPVCPHTNNNSISLIGSTIQRAFVTVVENALTTQFHSVGAKKNVVHGETISSVLNVMGSNSTF